MTGLEDETELAFWLPAWMVMPDLFRKTPSKREDDVLNLEGNFKTI